MAEEAMSTVTHIFEAPYQASPLSVDSSRSWGPEVYSYVHGSAMLRIW